MRSVVPRGVTGVIGPGDRPVEAECLGRRCVCSRCMVDQPASSDLCTACIQLLATGESLPARQGRVCDAECSAIEGSGGEVPGTNRWRSDQTWPPPASWRARRVAHPAHMACCSAAALRPPPLLDASGLRTYAARMRTDCFRRSPSTPLRREHRHLVCCLHLSSSLSTPNTQHSLTHTLSFIFLYCISLFLLLEIYITQHVHHPHRQPTVPVPCRREAQGRRRLRCSSPEEGS